MATVTFQEGIASVRQQVMNHRLPPDLETVDLLEAAGRVLAMDAVADRNYPPVARSVRDGFAVHSLDLPGRLKVIGEVRAGETFSGTLRRGEAVEIMTGAPVPDGADQIVMVEHTTRDGDFVMTERAASASEFINHAGSEARTGKAVLTAGRRLDFRSIAMLATIGLSRVSVFRRPTVAILATGDEIVDIGEQPRDEQVRNSNSQSLAIQVANAGGVPKILPIARDNMEDTRRRIAEGLEADLLLLSGGVSAGKYDLVERVLAEWDAEFYFDRVLVQPGQPLVFGRAQGKFFFGLPGNPASTMVTFEVFGSLAVRLLGGEENPSLSIAWAKLLAPFRHRKGLTRFLPAHLCGGQISPVPWQGSSDVPALAHANAFLIADSDRESWEAGEMIGVLAR